MTNQPNPEERVSWVQLEYERIIAAFKAENAKLREELANECQIVFRMADDNHEFAKQVVSLQAERDQHAACLREMRETILQHKFWDQGELIAIIDRRLGEKR